MSCHVLSETYSPTVLIDSYLIGKRLSVANIGEMTRCAAKGLFHRFFLFSCWLWIVIPNNDLHSNHKVEGN